MRHGLVAIAIEFPEDSFPDYLRYHFGNLHNDEGTPNPREQWTYGIVRPVVRRTARPGTDAARTLRVFGHSAGGQFVHRMLSFGFRDRVAVAVSANAGTYAMPDLEVAWPFGLGQTELDAEKPASVARVPDHRDGRHERYQDDRPVSSRRDRVRCVRARRGINARTTTSELGHAAAAGFGHALRLDGDRRAGCRP